MNGFDVGRFLLNFAVRAAAQGAIILAVYLMAVGLSTKIQQHFPLNGGTVYPR